MSVEKQPWSPKFALVLISAAEMSARGYLRVARSAGQRSANLFRCAARSGQRMTPSANLGRSLMCTQVLMACFCTRLVFSSVCFALLSFILRQAGLRRQRHELEEKAKRYQPPQKTGKCDGGGDCRCSPNHWCFLSLHFHAAGQQRVPLRMLDSIYCQHFARCCGGTAVYSVVSVYRKCRYIN